MKIKKLPLAVLGLSMWMLIGFVYGNNLLNLISPVFSTPEKPFEIVENKSRTIQVALLLDTSGSMEGLIEQAKSQLWNILNELARTKKDGEETELEIALYEYGSSSRGEAGIEINQLTPFTTDMDFISEKLFSLNTSGSNEYCGLMIHTALNDLKWKDEKGLKIIYIAGNESFDQRWGRVDYIQACQNAVEKGVVVNTIFCGKHTEGMQLLWQNGAEVGNGDYLSIDQNEVTVYVPTPYDDEITKLNKRLNETYIPYGKLGRSKKENQLLQDSNASFYSKANSADRAAFKSSKKYKTDDWDLASAYQKDKSVVNNQDDIPEEYQGMTMEDMEKKIQEVIVAREKVQKQIKELDGKRRAYKQEQNAEQASGGLQESIVKSLRKQAEQKGYKVEK